MKVVTWNVRGACSPHKKYILWETLLSKEWDVLCAVEHKCHELAGSTVHLRGYSSFYAGNLNNHYSGVVLIVRDKYYPQVVHNDPYGRFLVLEITFFGEVVWVVGIYAPNQATQRIALWGSLLQTLYVGRPGLLMGDFNMCVDASQSMSEHSIMDDPEQLAWDSLVMEVLKLDVWAWLHKTDASFTFQFAQHKYTYGVN